MNAAAIARAQGSRFRMLIVLASVSAATIAALAQSELGESQVGPPALPGGSESPWVVHQPEELVTYVLFDPTSVEDRLPPGLRFFTVGEVADQGIPWATRHLADDPSHRTWGISFLEIVRAGTFEIDGRSPNWPEHGAAALWAARVAPVESDADLGPGVPLLLLDFWLPDSLFATYMREKGYFAEYGDARLGKGPDAEWSGFLEAEGITVAVACTPAGAVSGGDTSSGMQTFYPPASSGMTDLVRVSFAGHRIQECSADSAWTLAGPHPLAQGIVLGSTTYQFGYDLAGGVYRR